jgi:hypothetical protein
VEEIGMDGLMWREEEELKSKSKLEDSYLAAEVKCRGEWQRSLLPV